MKKNVVTVTRKGNVQAKPAGLVSLITEVRGLIQSARHAAASTVNTLQVLTNFEIGRRIVNHEQQGEKRAKYGAELLKALSSRLTEEFGKGFSVSNLQLMRKFFLENQIRIQQQPAVKSAISEQALRKSPFTLSWTHYVTLHHQSPGRAQVLRDRGRQRRLVRARTQTPESLRPLPPPRPQP